MINSMRKATGVDVTNLLEWSKEHLALHTVWTTCLCSTLQRERGVLISSTWMAK